MNQREDEAKEHIKNTFMELKSGQRIWGQRNLGNESGQRLTKIMNFSSNIFPLVIYVCTLIISVSLGFF